MVGAPNQTQLDNIKQDTVQWADKAYRVKIAGTGDTTVDISTEDKQDDMLVELDKLLTELEKKADLTETQPVSVASFPLPTGAATSDNQINGDQTTQIVGVAKEYGKDGVDFSTNTLQSIDYPHHEIHGGSHYFIEGCATINNGSELRVKLVTPDTTKWAHFLWKIESSGTLTTELYEGASGGMEEGVSVTPINNNRNSANTSGLTITSGVSTATDDGILISQACWGTKQVGGSNNREDEIILKQNTTYLRKFISGTNGNLVSFKASWYEHINKN